jgi:hypothetical protein
MVITITVFRSGRSVRLARTQIAQFQRRAKLVFVAAILPTKTSAQRVTLIRTITPKNQKLGLGVIATRRTIAHSLVNLERRNAASKPTMQMAPWITMAARDME